jgi:hypothetical protein
VAELAFELIRDTTRKYVNTPEKKKAWDKALVTASHDLENWDRKTPRDYDERWITLHKVGGSPKQPIKKMSADQKKAIIEEEYRIFRENEPIN